MPTLAFALSADDQVTSLVMSDGEPLEKVPVAVRLVVLPLATMMMSDEGVIVMALKVGSVTVSVTGLEVTPLNEAVMVLLPSATPVASPVLLSIVTAAPEADQVSKVLLEMSPSTPSE